MEPMLPQGLGLFQGTKMLEGAILPDEASSPLGETFKSNFTCVDLVRHHNLSNNKVEDSRLLWNLPAGQPASLPEHSFPHKVLTKEEW